MAHPSDKPARDERLARALRENLKRRKAAKRKSASPPHPRDDATP